MRGLRALQQQIGKLWARTIVVIATEFGRTARVNGTGGTDHGTGGSIFLAGGALRGGRVVGQWPGLAPGELYQKRDVHATTDYRAVLKGILMQHLGASESLLESHVFPDSAALRPMTGLVRRV